MAFPVANRSLSCLITILCLVLIHTQKASSLIIAHMKNHHNSHRNGRPMYQSNQSSCALFVGNWVHDDSYPLYQYSACPAIDPRFNCQLYGRPDSGYLKYRWRPANCELPRFNGLDFVTRMRGKTVMFVGDSLGRNQWESLICMVSAGVPQSKTQMNGGETFSSFQFLDYGVTISYYKAPYLVDIDAEGGKNVLKLDEISKNGNTWRDADVLSFNTGHWWSHIGSLQGWDYIESGGSMYQDMDRLVAMERGLRTWARWVDANVDTGRTRVFFQSISPTHNSPSESNVGASTKNCYGETTPTSSSATYYSGEYTDQMQIVETVLREMNSPAYLLDVTMLSAMRKDAHPSIYSGDLNADQRANPGHSSDCSHWCLPGLPDTWNQLLYTALFF